MSREAWSAPAAMPDSPVPIPRRRLLAMNAEWRREALRMNLWLVPAIEIALAVILFAVTYTVDRAVYDGHHTLPSWVLTGSADAARQILTALAAAVITVIGVVFSIMIVTLTLASTQFGPRMLRNFIRDRGTQITLGTFVATFVFAVLTLASIGPGSHGDFVPHISVTVLLVLVLVDLGVLVYFIHHIAMSIQLPQVIASIARDLSGAIDIESTPEDRGLGAAPLTGPSVAELMLRIDESGGIVRAPSSGYLQFVRHDELVQIASRTGSVMRLVHRPGNFVVAGQPLAKVWPASAAPAVARELARCPRDRSGSHAGAGHRLRRRPAGRDRDPGALPGGQRHLHRPHLHRLADRQSLSGRAPMDPQACPPRQRRLRTRGDVAHQPPPARPAGLREDPPGWSGNARGDDPPTGRPRADHGPDFDRAERRTVLMEQADMIMRSAEESVPDPADRADVRKAYDALRAAAPTASGPATPR